MASPCKAYGSLGSGCVVRPRAGTSSTAGDTYFDGAPVLLSRQVASGKLHGAKQEIDQQKLFSAVTKGSHIVEQLGSPARSTAVAALAAGRTVTHVAVPGDVWQQEIPAAPG